MIDDDLMQQLQNIPDDEPESYMVILEKLGISELLHSLSMDDASNLISELDNPLLSIALLTIIIQQKNDEVEKDYLKRLQYRCVSQLFIGLEEIDQSNFIFGFEPANLAANLMGEDIDSNKLMAGLYEFAFDDFLKNTDDNDLLSALINVAAPFLFPAFEEYLNSHDLPKADLSDIIAKYSEASIKGELPDKNPDICWAIQHHVPVDQFRAGLSERVILPELYKLVEQGHSYKDAVSTIATKYQKTKKSLISLLIRDLINRISLGDTNLLKYLSSPPIDKTFYKLLLVPTDLSVKADWAAFKFSHQYFEGTQYPERVGMFLKSFFSTNQFDFEGPDKPLLNEEEINNIFFLLFNDRDNMDRFSKQYIMHRLLRSKEMQEAFKDYIIDNPDLAEMAVDILIEHRNASLIQHWKEVNPFQLHIDAILANKEGKSHDMCKMLCETVSPVTTTENYWLLEQPFYAMSPYAAGICAVARDEHKKYPFEPIILGVDSVADSVESVESELREMAEYIRDMGEADDQLFILPGVHWGCCRVQKTSDNKVDIVYFESLSDYLDIDKSLLFNEVKALTKLLEEMGLSSTFYVNAHFQQAASIGCREHACNMSEKMATVDGCLVDGENLFDYVKTPAQEMSQSSIDQTKLVFINFPTYLQRATQTSRLLQASDSRHQGKPKSEVDDFESQRYGKGEGKPLNHYFTPSPVTAKLQNKMIEVKQEQRAERALTYIRTHSDDEIRQAVSKTALPTRKETLQAQVLETTPSTKPK